MPKSAEFNACCPGAVIQATGLAFTAPDGVQYCRPGVGRGRSRLQGVTAWPGSTASSTPSATRRSCGSTAWRPPDVDLYVKVEAFNPLGSVKDRLALGVIEAAERAGELKPGQTVIEATSGNTGIGLAMVCAAKGYPLVVIMAESFSVERRKLMRFLGAKVILTPAAAARHRHGREGRGAGREARLVPDAASSRTRPTPTCTRAPPRAEILARLRRRAARLLGHRLRHRRHAEGRRARAAQGAAGDQDRRLRAGRRAAARQRHRPGAQPRRHAAAGHPAFKPHPMQGWTPDFIPKLTGDAVDDQLIDRMLPITGAEAMRLQRASSPSKEGIFVGITAGATFAGALQVAAEAPKGATILCMLPDTGERYLSTPLFADIAAEMNEDELAISRSTPRFQPAG